MECTRYDLWRIEATRSKSMALARPESTGDSARDVIAISQRHHRAVRYRWTCTSTTNLPHHRAVRYRWTCTSTTNLLRQAFWNVVWLNGIKWIIHICNDPLLRTVLVQRCRTTFWASRVPEPPFGVSCVKLVWKHHAPTL